MEGFNLMSWNVRGLNKRNKQLSILDICKLNKIGIGALLETKIKGERIKEVMSSSFMGWDFYSNLSLEGRILLIWKACWVKIEVIKDHVQFLHCKVQIWATGQSFCLTIVYGSNQLEPRRFLWSELSSLTFPVKPWLVVGDFNAFFDSADRMGGKAISIKELEDAIQWLDLGIVEEVKIMGSFYTWSNNQDGNNRIFSKLDRVFFNEDWLDSFPNVNAIANWEVVSDHCAIILKHIPVQKEGLRPFRFYNMWTGHPNFKITVMNSWNQPLKSEGRGLEQISSKLHRLKYEMKRFNWRVIGDIVKIATSGHIDSSVLNLGLIVNLEDQVELIKPFSYQDVKTAMLSINAINSPGPDGFGAVSHPTNASEYRPIACFNTLYKCISKMLCNRLTSILPKLVNQNQGAFVKNRSLAHNVLIPQDLIKGYNRKQSSPHCLMKIDISKAYDSIDWGFLENLLNAFRFPGRFIRWIMICLRGSSYCIFMNGQLQGSFKGGKGLRQGDPISPLLFVLVMEYLTRGLHGATKDKKFRFHPLCKSLNIANLCFADNLLLVCKAHANSIKIIQQPFETFSAASGLYINNSKSRIFFGGISGSEKAYLLSLSKMTEGTFPLVYLGMPLRPTKWKSMDCDIIISKIRQRLHGWAS
ncbi:uncharacterized protein LOC133832684 [Humulus lupulus]|uniref:uncharacterized protein LOC133832684 n=1 Tax=Humulus lupulus TaxID=3486 RepID=UPI002B40CD57|nr:uncharacterized protein LOC133832684 [Humulus lupulus]